MTGFIESFIDSDFEFLGAYRFDGENGSLLLSEHGTSIKLAAPLVSMIAEHNVPDQLKIKLFQRGFAKLYGRQAFQDRETKIDLRLFMIDFTNSCNLKCRYCFRDLKGKDKVIEDKILKDICDYIIINCRAHDVRTISIQGWGGEPLLAIDKIIWAVRYLRNSGLRVFPNIQTNGLLLTSDIIDRLSNEGINFGISIDGCRELHDNQRLNHAGQGTYDNLIKIVNESGLEHIPVICVNSKNSMGQISKSISSLRENFNAYSVKFNIMHPIGAEFDMNAMNEEDVEIFMNELIDSLIKSEDIIYEPNVVDRTLNLLSDNNEICHSKGCKGGYSFISFDMDGNIFPCETIGMQENKIGSIYDNPDLYAAIDRSIDMIPFFKSRLSNECNNCPFKKYCYGGCYSSINARGYDDKDKIECSINRIIYNRLISIIIDRPDLIEKISDCRIKMIP